MKTLVIGIGNLYRGDDAAGLIAARLLRERDCADVDIVDSDGSAFSLMNAWEGRTHVILIDAMSVTGHRPGEILSVAPDAKLLKDSFQCSTHAFGVSEAIAMSRALGTLPTNLRLIGIVGKAFEMSRQLSPEVFQAVTEFSRSWSQIINCNEEPKCTSSP